MLKYVTNTFPEYRIFYFYKNVTFLQEMLKDLCLFKTVKNKMSYLLNKTLNTYNSKCFLFYKYCVKSIIEDFFLINSFCKNSLIMNSYSKNFRTITKNFYF